jgi:DNA-binding MarR family transcriptional regulator
MAINVLDLIFKLPASVVTPTQRLVLLALGNHAHADGTNVLPQIATLARETSASPRAIHSALRELERKELVGGEKRHRRSTIYTISLAVLTRLATADPQAEETAQSVDVPKPAAVLVQSIRKHPRHAMCGRRVCLTERQADQFTRQLPPTIYTPEHARETILEWAGEIDRRLSPGGDLDDVMLGDFSPFQFWDQRFEEFVVWITRQAGSTIPSMMHVPFTERVKRSA